MSALLAVLTGVAVVSCAGLLSVHRRLTRLEGRLRGSAGHAPPAETDALVGTPVPDVAAVAVDGTAVAAGDLRRAEAVIGFFDVHCPPCHSQAPLLVPRTAGHVPTPPVAVVVGPVGAQREDLLGSLAGATVVTGADADRVAEAFGVTIYPTLLRTDGDGRIAAAVHTVADLVSAVPVVAPSP